MGAWEVENFGNDDAMDFVADVETGGKKSILTAIKTAADAAEYPEAPECCIALAAIEYIAAAKGNPSADFPEEAEEWLSKNKLLPFTLGGLFGIGAKEIDITSLSLSAIEKIKTRSELKELWEESGEFEKWLTIVQDLEKRIL